MNIIDSIRIWEYERRQPIHRSFWPGRAETLVLNAAPDDVCEKIKDDPCLCTLLYYREDPGENGYDERLDDAHIDYWRCRENMHRTQRKRSESISKNREINLKEMRRERVICEMDVDFIFETLRRRDCRLNLEVGSIRCGALSDDVFIFGSEDTQNLYAALQEYDNADLRNYMSDWYLSGKTQEYRKHGLFYPGHQVKRQSVDERSVWKDFERVLDSLRAILSYCEKNRFNFIMQVEYF